MMKKLIPILWVLLLVLSIPAIAVAAANNEAPQPPQQQVYLYVDSNLIIKDDAIAQLSTVTPNIAPVVKNGTTFVPLRAVAETFGATVSYDAKNKIASVEYAGIKGEFPIGKNSYSVDGKTKTLLANIYLSGGVTYVPLRAICENILGLQVDYLHSVISISVAPSTLNADTVSKIKDKLGAVLKVTSTSKLSALVQASWGSGSVADGDKNDQAVQGLGAEPSAAEDSSADYSGSQDYATNAQVAGIDEGDIVKVDGDNIYVCSSNRLVMLEANGDAVEELGEFTIPEGYIREMYVKDGIVALIGSKNDYIYYYEERSLSSDLSIMPPLGSSSVFVYVLEAANGDGEFDQLKYFEIEGNYTASRLKDDQLFLISNYYAYDGGDIIPLYSDSAAGVKAKPLAIDKMYYSAHDPGASYLDISTINISDDSPAQTTSAIGNGYTVYMSTDAIYATGYSWQDDSSYGTEILKFSVSSSGETSLMAVGYVEGYILNQFALDEYGGNLRIATTGDESNNIFVLDPFLNLIGELRGIAEDESIYAVRFIEDRGYLVTYRTIDPFFAFDLSDPTNPTQLGYLELPGYSNYLHPIAADLMLGIGYETQDIFVKDKNGRETVIGTRQGGIKLSLFDVSDPLNPVELDTEILGDAYSYTEAAYNHKAFMTDSGKGVYGFPATIYDDKSDYASGAVLLQISGKSFDDVTFAEAGEPDYSSDMYFQRLVYIGDTYYFIDYGTVYTVALGDDSCTEVYQIEGGYSGDTPVDVPVVYME
jgi:inhibitor of cysteine peptidase